MNTTTKLGLGLLAVGAIFGVWAIGEADHVRELTNALNNLYDAPDPLTEEASMNEIGRELYIARNRRDITGTLSFIFAIAGGIGVLGGASGGRRLRIPSETSRVR
jgi:hypothetical protein